MRDRRGREPAVRDRSGTGAVCTRTRHGAAVVVAVVQAPAVDLAKRTSDSAERPADAWAEERSGRRRYRHDRDARGAQGAQPEATASGDGGNQFLAGPFAPVTQEITYYLAVTARSRPS